jgi:hypothetical protein
MDDLVNFEKIDDKLLDSNVYRIYSLDKFLISLNEKSLHLIKPKLWDDPFEGFFLDQAFWRSERGTKIHWIPDIDKDRFYAQCWTFKNESDFLWRLYAPKKDGIMVRSTIRKLYNFLEGMPGKFYIGKVVYLSESEIKNKYKEVKKIKKETDFEKLIIESLLIKRTEFQEENEMRIIHYSPDSSTPGAAPIGLSFPLAFDSLDKLLFDEIIVDPRVNRMVYNSTKRVIETLGYKGNIRRSSLYDKPNFLIPLFE